MCCVDLSIWKHILGKSIFLCTCKEGTAWHRKGIGAALSDLPFIHTLSVYRFLTTNSLPVISVLMSLSYKFLIQCSKFNRDQTCRRLSQNSVTWFVCFEGCIDLNSTLHPSEQHDLFTVDSSTVPCQHTKQKANRGQGRERKEQKTAAPHPHEGFKSFCFSHSVTWIVAVVL